MGRRDAGQVHRGATAARRPRRGSRPRSPQDPRDESGQNLQPVLLHDGQQLERGAARALRSRLPLLHRAFAGVEVACKYGLTDVVALAKTLDLSRLERFRLDETGGIKTPHGVFADGADLV